MMAQAAQMRHQPLLGGIRSHEYNASREAVVRGRTHFQEVDQLLQHAVGHLARQPGPVRARGQEQLLQRLVVQSHCVIPSGLADFQGLSALHR